MVASHDDRDRDTRIDAMTSALILVFGDRAIEIAERQAISDIGRTGPPSPGGLLPPSCASAERLAGKGGASRYASPPPSARYSSTRFAARASRVCTSDCWAV